MYPYEQPSARTLLRQFLVRFKKRGYVQTANGKANLYAGCTRLSVQLRTSSSRKPLTLPYRSIRAAIHYLYAVRTVTRSDLEAFSRGYNSALLGILIEIAGSAARIQRTASGRLRLSLLGVRYYFAGADRSPRDLTIAAHNGASHVLFSYAHLRGRRAWKQHVQRLGLRILLDSGAFSVWRAAQQGKVIAPIDLQAYISFIQEHQDVIHAYFNLDVISDPAATRQNAEQMQAAGLQPIPVWHAGTDLQELQQLIQQEHPVIAVGGTVGMSEKRRRRIFRWVFRLYPEQNFHFLGGSSRLLTAFPWFSADSTGWLVGRKYGALIDAQGQRRAPEINGLQATARSCQYLASLEAAG
ncbi:hypothetical protein [Paenibacillus shenyangensis]|uniref:hypothetical protein n=1 Tax=Paenibacillus sp. A9 TaxID=1284352 RepID=UPI00035FC410|nr:hypothetical protein [Paenibacillus sp. A9]